MQFRYVMFTCYLVVALVVASYKSRYKVVDRVQLALNIVGSLLLTSYEERQE